MADFTTILAREALSLLSNRVIVLVGHFGSGKTELAINLSMAFARQDEQVTLIDLDLIKPYFRSRLLRDDYARLGVQLIVPEGDRFYADIPILVPQVKGHLLRAGRAEGQGEAGGSRVKPGRLLVDAGGSDLGARAAGSLMGAIDPGNSHLLFVVNTNRPFSGSVDEVLTTINRVEGAGRFKINGLIANNHLMDGTEPATIEEGIRVARQVGEHLDVPFLFASATGELLHQMALPGAGAVGEGVARDGGLGGDAGEEQRRYRVIREMFGCPVFPLERRILPPHLNYCDKKRVAGSSSEKRSGNKRPGSARVL